ncbi:hypothetical protein M0802_007178 [Mischocyttarus mexicanus]|nr:hypothetical protein M0802_007178 [Mischocyttarus mexicanus]
MGCKSSALKCMGLKRNPESHNHAKLDAKTSAIDTEHTDMYDIVAEKETLEEIRRSLEEDADYPVIVGNNRRLHCLSILEIPS